MKRLAAALLAICLVCLCGSAGPPQSGAQKNKNIGPPSSGFPRTVRVRLGYLHPPSHLSLHGEKGQAQLRTCATCAPHELGTLAISAAGSHIRLDPAKTATDLRISGNFQIAPSSGPPLHADFPVEISASEGNLLVTATMPMDEYIAGVLAGETGNFKSDEALKATAVAARTYAMHFGSRHALDNFDFCDTTHCQDLRIAGINSHLRQIAESTSGEVLWYEGEPAATYYHADCGGTTEDGRYILGNDEPPAPYLRQHSDVYCVRNGVMKWSSEIRKRDLQRALAADGISVPGTLRSVAVVQRTPSGRAEVLRLTGAGSITVSAIPFRAAVGRHIGWDRLKSNWYEVGVSGDRLLFHGRGSGHGVGLCQIGAEVMGEEGKTYREILAYYYPGTKLGVAAKGAAWKQLKGENIEMLTTRPDVDSALLPLAAQLIQQAQRDTGLNFRSTPQWKVFPTVEMFRNTTGEPGWVAAATRGSLIQTQPPEVLRQAGTLESTLCHELLHMLIESYAKPGIPVWYREGLVLYLSQPNAAVRHSPETISSKDLEKSIVNPASESELRQAYTEAHARVADLAKQYGRQQLILWVQQGLPDSIAQPH